MAISMLSADRGRHERVAEVERESLQMGIEVRARLTKVPGPVGEIEVPSLTSRQNEIVRRLARGQRVPAIAHDLFLGQSTVRNHLSASFRNLGVSSQSELIEKLRPEETSAP